MKKANLTDKQKKEKIKKLEEKLAKYEKRLAKKMKGFGKAEWTRYGDSYSDQLRDDKNALESLINSIKAEIESLENE